MSLSQGTRLGPLEVIAPLGAGGMGEVYRARDTRLGREVAVKVLSDEFSADTDRRTRFEQEARAASALNHPNIVTIYEIGGSDSTIYIAMELVEGKTLREVLPGRRCRSAGSWTSASRWRTASRRRTRPASSTGTSSPRTSWCPATARSRSSTSASRSS